MIVIKKYYARNNILVINDYIININIILKRNRSILFEKEYYSKFKIYDIDNIYQCNVNN